MAPGGRAGAEGPAGRKAIFQMPGSIYTGCFRGNESAHERMCQKISC